MSFSGSAVWYEQAGPSTALRIQSMMMPLPQPCLPYRRMPTCDRMWGRWTMLAIQSSSQLVWTAFCSVTTWWMWSKMGERRSSYGAVGSTWGSCDAIRGFHRLYTPTSVLRGSTTTRETSLRLRSISHVSMKRTDFHPEGFWSSTLHASKWTQLQKYCLSSLCLRKDGSMASSSCTTPYRNGLWIMKHMRSKRALTISYRFSVGSLRAWLGERRGARAGASSSLMSEGVVGWSGVGLNLCAGSWPDCISWDGRKVGFYTGSRSDQGSWPFSFPVLFF